MQEILGSPYFIPLVVLTTLKLLIVLIVQLRMSILKPIPSKFTNSISIIVCARNESDNLRELLPLLFSQEYPKFEVIVVNDRSSDDTTDILRAFERKYENLIVTSIIENEKFNFNKKFALTMGIKAASNDHVLLTDADCRPISNKWIRTMVAPFCDSKSISVGYGAYKKTTGLLNKIIRAETFLIAQQYFGIGKLGNPYMGVGRNLAYNTVLFYKNKGFSNHQHMASGDDDLFMAEIANRQNTDFVFSEESYTESEPEKTWKAYLEQKRRHLTTAVRYKFKTKAILALIALINYSFIMFSFLCLLIPKIQFAALAAIILVFITSILVSFKALKISKSYDLIPWLFITDVFILFLYPFALLYNYLQSGSLWKNY